MFTLIVILQALNLAIVLMVLIGWSTLEAWYEEVQWFAFEHPWLIMVVALVALNLGLVIL